MVRVGLGLPSDSKSWNLGLGLGLANSNINPTGTHEVPCSVQTFSVRCMNARMQHFPDGGLTRAFNISYSSMTSHII